MGVVVLIFEWTQQFARLVVLVVGLLVLIASRRALVFFVAGFVPFVAVAIVIYRSAPPYETILECVPICFDNGLLFSSAWTYLPSGTRDRLAAFSFSWLTRDGSSDPAAFESTSNS